ncbi:MAG: MOSC domain-containing protein [bacterium]
MSAGRVEGLWLKRAHRGPMDAVTEAVAVPGKGLANNVDRSSRRQITLLDQESWTRCLASVNGRADPSRRRANVLLSGIALAHTRGHVLRIGDVRIAIGGELTPCERMEEVAPGLQAALRPDWGGGVFGQVVDGGVIRVGDVVQLVPR